MNGIVTNRQIITVSGVLLLVIVITASIFTGPVAGQISNSGAAVAISNVTASSDSPTVGEPFALRVTITNFENSQADATINDLAVNVNGDQQYIAGDLGTLSPGSEITVTVPVTSDEPGQNRIQLELYGETSSGEIFNTETPYVVDVREPQQPSVAVSVPEAVSGATRNTTVTVANGADRPIDNVVLTVDSPASEVEFDETQRVAGELAAGATENYTFPARATSPGTYPIDVSVRYLDGGTQQEIERTFETGFTEPANVGEVRLTGVEATQRGRTVELSATASNVGGTEVNGVVVGIDDRAGISERNYFVGSIDASGFSTFTLQTQTSDPVSSIPVVVNYTTSGVQQSYVTNVSVARTAPTDGPPESDANSGLSLGAVLPLGLIIGVIVIGGILYRRRR
jgi:hypothetical protein